MNKLTDVELDRCLRPTTAKDDPQLHAFLDAGDRGFGTCIFLRWETDETVQLNFVAAKAFVAPLEHKSTPKMELMGAIAMSRLVDEVITALGYSFHFKRFWVDSKVVIHWLKSQSSRFIPFVATRIQEFQDSHNDVKQELRYVLSELNPADMLTKPIVIEGLHTWYEGPDFLKLPESSWPENSDSPESNSVLLEKPKPKARNYRKTKKVLAVQADTAEALDFGSRLTRIFASWRKLCTEACTVYFSSSGFFGHLNFKVKLSRNTFVFHYLSYSTTAIRKFLLRSVNFLFSLKISLQKFLQFPFKFACQK